MIGSGNSIRAIGLALIVVALTTAAIAFGFVRSSIGEIRNHWHENLLWPSSQLEIEYLRFRESLLRFGQNDHTVTSGDVNKRFDILWSRVVLFERGSTRDNLAKIPQVQKIIVALDQTMQDQERVVMGLQDGDTGSAVALLSIFDAHYLNLRLFNRRVMKGEVALGAELREDLWDNYILLTWLSSGAVLVSLALLMFFAAESGRQRKIAEENRMLLEGAKAANRAKAAFLSMMSHDLRTPMNGIMGMIALAKRQSGKRQQAELLDQAAVSSSQMSNLLSNILDFAALEDASSQSEDDVFEMVTLHQEISSELEISARHEGLDFTATLLPGGPAMVIGDIRRLRQITVHLARFLGRNTPNLPVEIQLSYVDGHLKVQLEFYYASETDDWQPEIILGQGNLHKDSFTNDGLGPAIARGFTENMGGELHLHMPASEKTAGVVILAVPLKKHSVAQVVVRIKSRSPALAAICASAMKMNHVRVLFDDGDMAVDTVVIESGGSFEADACRDLRLRHPDAIFVALGEPTDPTQFQAEIGLPIDIVALKHASFLHKANLGL